MNQRAKKIATFVVRWGIAVVGIWWVVAHMSMRDRIVTLNLATNLPVEASLAEHADENAQQFKVIDPKTGKVATVDRSQTINPTPPRKIKVLVNGKTTDAMLLGMRLRGDINRNPSVDQLLIQLHGSNNGTWISPHEIAGGFRLDVPRPRVEVGIISMCQHANPWLLVLAVAIFPLTFIITSYRWNKLLEAIDVHIGLWRAFELNMVGAFYNTFMPGSVGGDVFKMYYASRQTVHRTRAAMSVIIDRILGMLALVMVGGVMAAYQYMASPDKHDPAARACLQVAIAAVAVMGGVGLMLAVMFQRTARRWLGLEYVLTRLPMQRQIENARQVMRIYRDRPVLVLWALLVTVPVHVTVIISAMLAGKAFGLPIQPVYYFAAVPVIVLVGSLPISPQGAGVMEFFAIKLTQRQGATVSQAFALTMSIRVVQILWNLTGGIFVLRGGFHAPTESEKQELNRDDESTPPAASSMDAAPPGNLQPQMNANERH